MFLSINVSFIPPSTSRPNVSGVTSTRRISVETSPEIIAPCIAAPIATASIGSTPLSGSLPITVSTNCLTIGILVGPPIIIILSMSPGTCFASWIACIIGPLHFSTIGLKSSSSLDLVKVIIRFFGPVDGS